MRTAFWENAVGSTSKYIRHTQQIEVAVFAAGVAINISLDSLIFQSSQL